ncbi:MAG: helix-turn-helix transcriptional regulator [Pseudonocardiaceae bacterium]
MANQRYARHIGITHVLRSRQWVSAVSLANRFGVSQRTIYRDIENLIDAGIPIEAVAGREGGYRLNSDSPIDPLILDADDALRLYVLGVIDSEREHSVTEPELLRAGGISAYARELLRKLTQRIYFDTGDWYWKDEGSGHIPTVRYALLTSTAIEISIRTKQSAELTPLIVKPYGLVWKGGEWWLVAAPQRGEVQRYRLNPVDRLVRTDLRFTHPEDKFELRRWWTQALEDHGRGPNRVVLRVLPSGREEMLRLGLKPDSEVHHDDDGTVRIVLYVDKWLWLVPLIASFGSDVVVEEPADLRAAVRQHHADALRVYDAQGNGATTAAHSADYRNDDSRLRSTRGRNPRSVRE